MTAEPLHRCRCDTKGAAWNNGSDLQTQVRAVVFGGNIHRTFGAALPMLPPPVRRQRAGIAQRMDLNHKNTFMVPKLNVQSVCICFNAFSQILQCLFGRSATRVVSKTHRQDPMILRHVSACMLRFVKQMISCFWYAIFPPSVILLSYYEGRKRASSFRHRCSIVDWCVFTANFTHRMA